MRNSRAPVSARPYGLILLVLCASCSAGAGGTVSGGESTAGGNGDSDGGPGGANGGGDDDDDPCAALACGDGRGCDDSVDSPVCFPSCEGVSCADGLTCRIEGDVGRCGVVCASDCGAGQRCELVDSTAVCIDNTCADLSCGATEACAAVPSGKGFVCVDNTCTSDLSCAEGQNCNGQICVGDACVPGTSTCQAGVVRECMANGAGEIERVACPSAEGLLSECVVGANGAACTCRDDWDCPAYTECVQGSCEGTGREPACFLAPLPFAALLPQAEPGFPWGGDDADGYNGNSAQHTSVPPSRDAAGSPFQRHAQVSAVPIVANLDDDNGDGLVNERDIPEIVFTSFCDQNYFNHGVLRAVHGGGVNAGKDFFAVCENKLWKEGDPLVDDQGAVLPSASCACGDGDIEPTGALAVGDLDGEDGLPEIVVVGHNESAGAGDVANHRILIFRNTGELISSNPVQNLAGANPAVTLANVDGQGFAEIIVGSAVFSLARNVDGLLVVSHALYGAEGKGINNSQGAVSCAADLTGDGRMEIVAGGTVYTVPRPYEGECPADASALDAEPRAYCQQKLVPLWNAAVEGFCAVADVLPKLPEEGAPEVPPSLLHPLDGNPEVVLISSGRLRIYDGKTGASRVDLVLNVNANGTPKANGDGGPPNIDDFDGDGFPEIATAFSDYYTVHDLQPATAACPTWPTTLDGNPASASPSAGNPERVPPALGCMSDADCGDTAQFACGKQGSCVCLHNGWRSATKDASSRVTGSSVFDFNGDGAAEVVYNDECFFRIYDGSTGRVYQRLDSQSPTRIEYPVVADVDSDGNAEIVFSGSNARTESCVKDNPGTPFLNGINVIGDPTDRWISARRMWNQHAYHVTNVQEDGAIPLNEVANWQSYGGRSYNTYRSNLPPVGNVAPDLRVLGVQVSSPDVQCGAALSQDLRIVALVANVGDLRVGPDVAVRFSDQTDAELGRQTLGVPLEPGREVFVTLSYSAASVQELPTKVRATIDPDGLERECNEDNNTGEADVTPESLLAELRVTVSALDTSCPTRKVRVTVFNDGATPVASVPVQVFAGNPAGGGQLLLGTTVSDVPAEGSVTVDLDVNVGARDVVLHVVVDPDRQIPECDDGNNVATLKVNCSLVIL